MQKRNDFHYRFIFLDCIRAILPAHRQAQRDLPRKARRLTI